MASKQHKLVGKLLKDLFPYFHINEEVKVSDLVEGFGDNRKRIDWYVRELLLVVEVHGAQHYKGVAFGYRNAKLAYVNQIHRDIEKQAALENAGYYFLEIPYWESLTLDKLKELIEKTII